MQKYRNVKGMRKVEPLVLGVETKVWGWGHRHRDEALELFRAKDSGDLSVSLKPFPSYRWNTRLPLFAS